MREMYLKPSKSELISAEDLRMRLTGLLPEGAAYGRITHLEEVYAALPRDPQIRIEVSTVEIAPQSRNDFHFHNGTAIYLILQGQIRIEFPDETREYSPGDAYVEPIGLIHRAFNPHPSIPLLGVGVSLTPVDRTAIVNLPQP